MRDHYALLVVETLGRCRGVKKNPEPLRKKTFLSEEKIGKKTKKI